MSDAPILSTLNLVADLSTAGDFEKKHTPHINLTTDNGETTASVTVGHYVAHPNQPDHFIQWIELFANGNPIARFDLSPVATDPNISVTAHLDAGTVVRAVAYCNLHGLWAAEVVL